MQPFCQGQKHLFKRETGISATAFDAVTQTCMGGMRDLRRKLRLSVRDPVRSWQGVRQYERGNAVSRALAAHNVRLPHSRQPHHCNMMTGNESVSFSIRTFISALLP
jgi:hypothetical protein